MSDAPQGPGWWLASDGKWYPPQPPATPARPMPPAPPATPSSGRKALIGLGACGALLVLAIMIGALASGPTKDTQSAGGSTSTTTSVTASPQREAAGDPTTSATAAEESLTTTTTAPTTTARQVAPDEYYSGSGDAVQNVTSTIREPRIATITYQGSSNFAVKALYANGGEDLLVNTIGSYSGTVPLGFRDGEHVEAFEVSASGPWSITVKDITTAPILDTTAGARVDGQGDSVLIFAPGTRTTLAIACPGCASNFAVHSYGRSIDLLVNEIGAYSGSVSASADTLMLAISADADFDSTVAPAWSITVQ